MTNSAKADVATEGSFEASAQVNQARAARSRKEAEWEKRQLELMIEAGSVELESSRVRLQSIESELTAAQAEVQMRRELEAVLRARLQQQKQQLDQKDSVIERLQAEINQLTEEKTRSTERMRGLEHKVVAAHAHIDKAASNHKLEIALVEQQLKTAREQLRRGEDRISEESRAILANAEKQEQRLKVYAQMLRDQRSRIQGYCRESAEIIQSAYQNHPLQDYLKATEFEVSRVERELRVIGSSGAQRSKLENSFARMIEQRDFLRSVIDASREQLANNADRIFKLGSDDALPPVPPVLPRVGRPSGSGKSEG